MKHVKEVCWIASIMATELKIDVATTRRGALLHDIGKVLTHEHEGTHVQLGVEVARKYGENEVVINCIEAHHDDVPHGSVMSVIVQAADSASGARPGARHRRGLQHRQPGLGGGHRTAVVHRRGGARGAARREEDGAKNGNQCDRSHQAFPARSGTKRTGSSAVSV